MHKGGGKSTKLKLQINKVIHSVKKLPVYVKVLATIPLVIALLVVAFSIYNLYFLGKILPGIYIANYYVGGQTPKNAATLLSQEISYPEAISLTYQNQNFSIPISSFDFSYDYDKSVETAYSLSRSDDVVNSIITRILIPFKKSHLSLVTSYNQGKLQENLSVIAGQVGNDPKYPYASLIQNEVVVDKGAPGEDLDQEKLMATITENLSKGDFSSIAISTKIVDPSLSPEEATLLKERATKLLNKTLVLSFENDQFDYANSDLFKFLDVKNDYNDKNMELFSDEISTKIERSPQNPVFTYQDGVVKEFEPAKDGVKLDKDKFLTDLKSTLSTLEESDKKQANIAIPTINSPPDYRTEDVNNLGIKELLGIGKSKFAHSISSRIHNIALASSKFNGILVNPGDVFSFNDTLGDVSSFTGYKQAYVIKDGKTVLGDGGGVCQVSTTFFRAILDAGLPIVERRAHSYRVGYYEQDSPPGIDATVYAPTTDLKFKNDTPGHLLIQTRVDTKAMTLVFEIYGTSDGRISQISKPVVTDVTPPPEDLYIDDPTLPAGKIEQIDWKAWGAKVSFNYTVTRGNETLTSKTFYSNYQPWQAKFLRGTGPAI